MNAAARAAVPRLLCGGTLRYVALRATMRRALPASQCMRRAVVCSDGFIGRSAITAGRSTARRGLTVPLVSSLLYEESEFLNFFGLA